MIKLMIKFSFVKYDFSFHYFKYKYKYNLTTMSEEVAEVPPSEKTQEQIQEQLRQKQQEQRLKQEERKKAEQEAKIKAQQDLRKLQQALKGALSSLGKTSNNRSMTYNRLILAQKELQRLFPIILRYKQIRYIDLNTNTISDVSIIEEFTHLIWLNASKNQIPNLNAFISDKLEQLQFLNLSGNKIKILTTIALPSLKRLNLSQNQISEITWKGHTNIQILELRKNKLRNLKGIANMKNLKQLYVCENELTDIRGLQQLSVLQKISVRNNKLKGLYTPFPNLPALTYLNLRQNQIAKLQQLKKIELHVTGINILQNPITQQLGQNLKKQLIYVMPHLIKINKSDVTVQERVAFEKELIQKLAEKQRQRLAQQQQARKAAEQSKVAQ